MCGALRPADSGKKAVLMGWVNRRRDLGNLVFIRKLYEDFGTNEVRLCLLSHHYRSEWEFTDGEMAKEKKIGRPTCWAACKMTSMREVLGLSVRWR